MKANKLLSRRSFLRACITYFVLCSLLVFLINALANALIHAGYYDRRGLVVQKWPDRIRITNPGAFRIDVQEALVGGVSDPRNVADQDVQSHQCERARRQRPAQHPRCLAEAALENAGDHREFRSRPHHAAAAGLGKKWR